MHTTRLFAATLSTLALAACSAIHTPSTTRAPATLAPSSPATRQLLELPEPRDKMVVAVVGFKDETGQYPGGQYSPLSTAVTQDPTSILIKALKDSGWFVPVDRASLPELLTERELTRASRQERVAQLSGGALDGGLPAGSSSASAASGSAATTGAPLAEPMQPLSPASLLIQGSITAYDTQRSSGGSGARLLGVGASAPYRVDEVSVNLRLIDVNTGEILQNVSASKDIYSNQLAANVYRYSGSNEISGAAVRVSNEEPAQLAVKEAIEAAVLQMIRQGVGDLGWQLRDDGTTTQ